jgi:hypothetical protein
MLGVANVYLNRYYSNWGGSQDRGPDGFKQAVMDASTPVFRRTDQRRGDHTSRSLYSDFQSTLNRVLTGSANDAQGNCAGLIFSFQFAQNVVQRHFGLAYDALPPMNIYNNVGDSLYFRSYSQMIPRGFWEWGGAVDYYNSYYTPKYGGGYKPFHFFTKRGARINRPTGL